jgi:N-acetylneuraminic acid mutarotase
MRNIFEKLGVQSRTEASLRAIQEGLVYVENEAEPTLAPSALIRGPGLNPFSDNPPLNLPRWQQFYLLAALLTALAFIAIPLLPRQRQAIVPDLPVIYVQPSTPEPPTQPNGGSTRWVPHAPMPTSRAGLALVAVEDKFFAIGGVRGTNKATRSVEIYDPATDSWREGANTLVAAANISGAVLDGKIYVPGGCTNEGKAVDSLGIYDPVADIWTLGPPLPAARCGYGLVKFDDELYLFGGWNGTVFRDSVFVYSPTEDRWRVLETSMPMPSGYVGAAALDDTIYIVGGYDGHNEFDKTYAFKPRTGEWVEKAPLLEKRGGLGLISSGDNLFAIGGGWDHALQTSEKYDPELDNWTSFETPFISRWRNMGLAVIDTKIYAIGGWDGTEEKYINTVVSYQYLYQLFLPISGSDD